MKSGILTNSPYIWISLIFWKWLFQWWAIFHWWLFTWKISKIIFKWIRKNPEIHRSIHFCDFFPKMTISAWNWKFWNFSEFSLGICKRGSLIERRSCLLVRPVWSRSKKFLKAHIVRPERISPVRICFTKIQFNTKGV